VYVPENIELVFLVLFFQKDVFQVTAVDCYASFDWYEPVQKPNKNGVVDHLNK
jgi:hypothetical protein